MKLIRKDYEKRFFKEVSKEDEELLLSLGLKRKHDWDAAPDIECWIQDTLSIETSVGKLCVQSYSMGDYPSMNIYLVPQNDETYEIPLSAAEVHEGSGDGNIHVYTYLNPYYDEPTNVDIINKEDIIASMNPDDPHYK